MPPLATSKLVSLSLKCALPEYECMLEKEIPVKMQFDGTH
jgi:hypothetical protein